MAFVHKKSFSATAYRLAGGFILNSSKLRYYFLRPDIEHIDLHDVWFKQNGHKNQSKRYLISLNFSFWRDYAEDHKKKMKLLACDSRSV